MFYREGLFFYTHCIKFVITVPYHGNVIFFFLQSTDICFILIHFIDQFTFSLLEDIPLCLKYINTNKIKLYSIEHNNVLIALVATSFGRQDHHQANVAQKLKKKGWLHVVHKNV